MLPALPPVIASSSVAVAHSPVAAPPAQTPHGDKEADASANHAPSVIECTLANEQFSASPVARPRPVAECAVSLSFLTAFAKNLEADWTAADVVFKNVITTTQDKKCRYVDMLADGDVGPPTYFVSHRWSDPFVELVERLNAYVQEHADPDSEPYFWIDIFAVNQHPGAAQQDDLKGLEDAITSATKGTLLILDKEGLTLTRIWCLFEIHKTIMLRKEASEFIALLPKEINLYAMKNIWTELDVAKAQATVEADRVRLLAEFAASDLGFHKMNHSIKAALLRSSEHSLEMQRQQGSSKVYLQDALQKYAGMLQLTGDVSAALPLMTEAIGLIDEDSQSTQYAAYLFYCMGTLLQEMDKVDDALAYHEKSLAINRKLLGDDHPQVASIYSSTATLLHDMGKFDEALTYHEKSLAILRKGLGEEHRSVAAGYSNLAALLRAMGRTDDALLYFQNGLAIFRKLLGEEHPDVAANCIHIGSLLEKMGREEDALAYYEKSLAIRRKVLGDEHPQVTESYNSLGSLLHDLGKLDAALGYFEKSLAIRRKVLGEEHADVASVYHSMGSLLRTMGQWDDALEYYEKDLAISRKILGEHHPAVATTYTNMALLLKDMSRLGEALGCFEKGLSIRRQVYGDHHADVAISYNFLGRILEMLDRSSEAAECFRHRDRINAGNNRAASLRTTESHDSSQTHPNVQHGVNLPECDISAAQPVVSSSAVGAGTESLDVASKSSSPQSAAPVTRTTATTPLHAHPLTLGSSHYDHGRFGCDAASGISILFSQKRHNSINS